MQWAMWFRKEFIFLLSLLYSKLILHVQFCHSRQCCCNDILTLANLVYGIAMQINCLFVSVLFFRPSVFCLAVHMSSYWHSVCNVQFEFCVACCLMMVSTACFLAYLMHVNF